MDGAGNDKTRAGEVKPAIDGETEIPTRIARPPVLRPLFKIAAQGVDPVTCDSR